MSLHIYFLDFCVMHLCQRVNIPFYHQYLGSEFSNVSGMPEAIFTKKGTSRQRQDSFLFPFLQEVITGW